MPEFVKSLPFFYEKNCFNYSYSIIERSALQYDVKHPIFIPKKSHFTKLLNLKCPQLVLHVGVANTLSKVSKRLEGKHY